MQSEHNERIIQAIKEIETEYRKVGGELLSFLFAYCFPRIDVKTDYAQDGKGRERCFCSFQPSAAEQAKKNLDILAEYIEIKYYKQEFSVFLDLSVMTIPSYRTDEEYGEHTEFYEKDSGYMFKFAKTKIALKDKDTLAELKKEQIVQYVLIKKITELFRDITGITEDLPEVFTWEYDLILDKGKLKKGLKKVYPGEKEEAEKEKTRREHYREHYCYKPSPPPDYLK